MLLLYDDVNMPSNPIPFSDKRKRLQNIVEPMTPRFIARLFCPLSYGPLLKHDTHREWLQAVRCYKQSSS